MYDERQENWDNLVRGGGIIVLVFLFTLFIYFTCTQFLDSAKGRITPLYGKADGTLARAPQSPSRSPGFSPIGPTLPQVTAGFVPPARILPPPVVTPPAVFSNYRPGQLLFRNDAERNSVREAVRSLKVAVQNVRHYDGASFWQPLPGGTGTGISAPQKAAVTAGSDDETGAASRLYSVDTEADVARQREKALTRISNETEALGTELVLVAHPDIFPEELRDTVDVVSVEARTYLSTVQLSLGNPETRTEFRSLAQAHLARAEAAVHQLESAVGGLGGPGYGSGNAMD